MGAKNPRQPQRNDHPDPDTEHASWEEEPEPPRHSGWLGGLRPFSMRKKVVAMGLTYFTLFFLICSAIAPTVIDHLATLNLIHIQTDQDQDQNNTSNNSTPTQEMTLAEADFQALDGLESMDGHWYWYQDGTGTRNLANGGVYLNLTQESSQNLHSHVILGDHQGGRNPGKGNPWLYASMETRLRVSSQEGAMFWGFADEFYDPFANCLFFMSNPPESDPEFAGVLAAAKATGNETIHIHRLEGIDPTQWHNYTILWEEDNATWLVDGVAVWQSQNAPADPMSIRIEIMNERYVKSGAEGVFMYGLNVWGLPIKLEQDIQIQVEQLRVFADRDEIDERAKGMEEDLSTARDLIQTAAERGMNTTKMWAEYTDARQDLESKGLIHAELNLRIIHINEHLDEVSRLYAQAKELIEKKKQDNPQDRNLIILESRLNSAQTAWDGDSYTLAVSHLENILATQT